MHLLRDTDLASGETCGGPQLNYDYPQKIHEAVQKSFEEPGAARREQTTVASSLANRPGYSTREGMMQDRAERKKKAEEKAKKEQAGQASKRKKSASPEAEASDTKDPKGKQKKTM